MLRKYIYSEKSDDLYFEKVHSIRKNTKIAIIFLHGIVGSRRSWGREYHHLSTVGNLYFIDLLGYGFSAKPNTSYTLEVHVNALHEWITKNVMEEQIIFVSHSLGAVIALAYTAQYSDRIRKTFLLALPYYHNTEEAKRLIATRSSKFTFIFSDSLQTKIVCTLICSVFGTITRQISPLFMRDLPRPIAQDVHRHSYQSYISTLTHILYTQSFHSLFANLPGNIILIHGSQDKIVPVQNLIELSEKYSIPLQLLEEGEHRFPIDHSHKVIDHIAELSMRL